MVRPKYMLDFSNYSQKYANNWNIKNSLVSYLTLNNKQYFKSNNFIKGFYKDTILKDFIYISSSGFKNDTFIRKNRILNNIINSNDLSFVSYFTMRDSKIFKLNLFSSKYYNTLSKTNIDKEKKIHKYLVWDYNKTKNLNEGSEHNIFSTDYLFSYNKLILLRNQSKKLTAATETGIIKQINPTFYSKICFTGLISILSESVKYSFINILSLNYLLLEYFSNIILTEKNNKNLIYIANIYYALYKFFNLQFFQYFKNNTISLRKSNKFLNKYIIFFKNKIDYIIEKCKNSIYSKLLFNNLQKTWLNWFFHSHNNHYGFLNYNTDSINNKLSTYSTIEKISIFNKIIYILELSLFNKIPNINFDVITKFERYLILKSFLTYQSLKTIFNYPVFFNNFSIKFPNYELVSFLIKKVNTDDIYNESLKFLDNESFYLSTIHLKKIKYYNYLLDIFSNKLVGNSNLRLFKKIKKLKLKNLKKKKFTKKVSNYQIRLEKRSKLNVKLQAVKLERKVKILKLTNFLIDSNQVETSNITKTSGVKKLVPTNIVTKLMKNSEIYKNLQSQKQLNLKRLNFLKQINMHNTL